MPAYIVCFRITRAVNDTIVKLLNYITVLMMLCSEAWLGLHEGAALVNYRCGISAL